MAAHDGGRPSASTPARAAAGPAARARAKKRFNTQGLIVSIITTALAFLVGGLVVLATGPTRSAPTGRSSTARESPGSSPATATAPTEASNLQQTLIVTTPLILCGLAVAFAFRCGMFNIGGQGQYFAGSYAAVIVGSSWAEHPGPAHIVLCIVLAISPARSGGGSPGS